MVDEFEKLRDILKNNRMSLQHEVHGYPRGWNAALEFVEDMIQKRPQKAEIENNRKMITE